MGDLFVSDSTKEKIFQKRNYITTNEDISGYGYGKSYETSHGIKWISREYQKRQRKKNKKSLKIYAKKYRGENKKYYREHEIKWREENPEESKKIHKRYYKKHRKEIINRKLKWAKEYYKIHKDEIREQVKKYQRTKKGKEAKRKNQSKRRTLGFIPLNFYFLDSNAHHIDTQHVIYIPEEMHKSIYHNVWTGDGMDKINELAFDFLNGKF